jgi:predicted PurR-regulated permease PerM
MPTPPDWIAGVPFAGLLTAVMLFLCIAQVGPSPVLVPAVIWLYWSGEAAGARFCSCGPWSW